MFFIINSWKNWIISLSANSSAVHGMPRTQQASVGDEGRTENGRHLWPRLASHSSLSNRRDLSAMFLFFKKTQVRQYQHLNRTFYLKRSSFWKWCHTVLIKSIIFLLKKENKVFVDFFKVILFRTHSNDAGAQTKLSTLLVPSKPCTVTALKKICLITG